MNNTTAATTSGQLLRNGLYNSSGWFLNIVIQLVAIPFLVKKLGMQGYGIYFLLVSFVGYYILIDLGLGQGVIKYVAEFRAKGDAGSLNRFVNAALWVQLSLGFAGALMLFCFAEPCLRILRVPPAYFTAARTSLHICAGAFFFTMIQGTFSSVLMGLQRFDLTAKVNVASNLLMTGGILLAVYRGGGLIAAVAITAFFAMTNCVVCAFLVKKSLPAVVFFSIFDRASFRILFNFSGFLFISRLSSQFCSYFAGFMISFFLGPAAVPLFVVSWRLVNAASGFLGNATTALFPLASEMMARDEQAKISHVFLQTSRCFAAFSIPVNLAIAAFAKPILTVWMGKPFADQAAGILTLLGFASMLGSMTVVPILMAMGMGHSKVIGLFSLLVLASYLIFIPGAIHFRGISGIGWAMLLATIPGICLVVYELKKIFHVPLSSYFRKVFGFHVLPIVLVIGYALFLHSWLPLSGIRLLLLPLLFITGYFLALVLSRWLPLGEIAARMRASR